MPRKETILSVFVASPSDVVQERDVLISVIQELNKTWSNNLNIRLDLIKWDTDTVPGFGDYSQKVINDQIDDEYDVFIAIFWSKVGTPTKMADSGTLEELERAYKKYRADPTSVDLMVYFKDQALSPSKMDFEQLQKIEELKEKLGEQGGLYGIFERTEDFEPLIRVHLSKIAQRWSRINQDNVSQKVDQACDTELNTVSDEGRMETEEEYGLFDYIGIYDSEMTNMTAALSSMSDATVQIGSQFKRRTEEINLINDKEGQANTKQIRKIIKSSGDDMVRYSKIMEAQIKVTSKSRKEAFDALSKAISLYVDLCKETDGKNSISELERNLEDFSDAANKTIGGLTDFQEIISKLPKLTAYLNKAKRRTANVLNDVLNEIKMTVQTADDVLGTISELKNN